MTNYAIVQNPDQSTQPRSFIQFPALELPVFPPVVPAPTLTEVVHGLSTLCSFGALFVAALGNDKQRDAAMKVLDLSTRVMAITALKSLTSLPAHTIRTDYVVIPPTPSRYVTQQEFQELKRIVGEVCRRGAVTEAELTLLRVGLWWDGDNT